MFVVVFCIFFLYAVIGSIYTLVTGDVLFTNIHYSVAGRILQTVIVCIAFGFAANAMIGGRKAKRDFDHERRRKERHG